MKVSIITPVLNRTSSIGITLDSLIRQIDCDYEHIIQDGGSTDGTIQAIKNYDNERIRLFVGSDLGIYDALNHAMDRCDGDIIGVLHAGDLLAEKDVLANVVNQFELSGADICYGNINYFDNTGNIKRVWRGGHFDKSKVRYGWMPPHTAVFIRRAVLKKMGKYDINYRISGDYDWLLRLMLEPNLKFHFMNFLVTSMSLGGVSTKLENSYVKISEDFCALKQNGVNPFRALPMKYLQKLNQIKLWV